MTTIFKFCDDATYNLRRGQVLECRHSRTKTFGIESTSALDAKTWALVPKNLREAMSLNSFKQGIKKWNPAKCFCQLCKTYVQDWGFI